MSVVRAAFSMSGLTLLSRVLGLVRDVAMTHVLGVSWASGTFNLAWMLPNMLRRLLGEGALSAAFIPAYTKTRDADGDDAARRLLADVSGILLVVVGILTTLVLIGSLVLPPTVWNLEGNGEATVTERGELMWSLLVTLFPYAAFVCLLALYAGALNTLGVFAIPAAAPALLNVVWLVALGAIVATGLDDLGTMTLWIARALLIGGALQLLLGLLPLARRGQLDRPRLPERRDDPSVRVFRAMGPTLVGLSLAQVNLLISQFLAEYLVAPGANNHIYLANRLLLFPHALVALPLATAVFPTLASLAGREQRDGMRDSLREAMTLTQFLAIPATAGLIAIASDFVEIVFVHGRYSLDDAFWTRWTTVALVAGLPFIGAVQLYARALFALGDARTPARVAGWLVLVNLVLVVLFVPLGGAGVVGFTLASTCCSIWNALLLRRAVRRHGLDTKFDRAGFGRTIAASAAMLALIVTVRPLLEVEGGRAVRALVHLALPVVVGIVAYVLVHAALGSPELRRLRNRLRRRG